VKHGRGGAWGGGCALQCLQFPNIQPGNSNMVINKETERQHRPRLLTYTPLQHIPPHSTTLFTSFFPKKKKNISNHSLFISHHLLFK
jgi:hypothetical protein